MIPVLDWSRFSTGLDRNGFVADLGLACRETGFFLVSGHGIPQSLIDDTFAAADRFFPTAASHRSTSGEAPTTGDGPRPDRKISMTVSRGRSTGKRLSMSGWN